MSETAGEVPADGTITIDLNMKCCGAWGIFHLEAARLNPDVNDVRWGNFERVFARGYRAAFEEFSRLAAAHPGSAIVALDRSHPVPADPAATPTDRLGHSISSSRKYPSRDGQWGTVYGLQYVLHPEQSRWCYIVGWPDGDLSLWPVDDEAAGYEWSEGDLRPVVMGRQWTDEDPDTLTVAVEINEADQKAVVTFDCSTMWLDPRIVRDEVVPFLLQCCAKADEINAMREGTLADPPLLHALKMWGKCSCGHEWPCPDAATCEQGGT